MGLQCRMCVHHVQLSVLAKQAGCVHEDELHSEPTAYSLNSVLLEPHCAYRSPVDLAKMWILSQ